jgi:signal transduction histidine kinase
MNAVRHNKYNGLIRVDFSKQGFIVANTGISNALNEASLFKRFSSSSSQTPGSGLGLAIVKQICSRYHWQIGYSFDNGFHTFSTSF